MMKLKFIELIGNHTFINILGIYSAAPPPPPPPPPPAVRPKKPPRLLQYAQQTLNRHSINVALNTSIKTSLEKTDISVTTPPAAIPQRTSNGPLQGGSNCK